MNNQYGPFPVDALPEPVKSYVIDAAAAIGCDATYIALPLLSTLASSIGAGYRIQLKHDWTEPSVVWVGTIGESGTCKSPAMKLALEPLEEKEHQAIADYQQARAQYEIDKANYERLYDAWRKRGKDRRDEDPPAKPSEPVCTRYIVSDITIESLALKLQENPRGLVVGRDELCGWINSLSRYRQDASDAPAWLSMWSAGPIRVDRKIGNTFTYVPRAAVSICGGIQPGTLRRALTPEYRENGLGARLLLAYPPRQARRWSESEIHPTIKMQICTLINDLLSLPIRTDESGHIDPIDIPLSASAKRRFVQYVDQHGAEQYETTTGELSAVWSKLEAYAARFALIIHLVRVFGATAVANSAAGATTTASSAGATDDGPGVDTGTAAVQDAERIDELSIESGIVLADWFGNEARRIYALLAETEHEQGDRELIELIQRHGGEITSRDLSRNCRSRFPDADDAEAALIRLAELDHGGWTYQEPGPQGGRPTSTFRLKSYGRNDETPENTEDNEVMSPEGGNGQIQKALSDNKGSLW
jgi:hypothetical protein